MYWNKRCKTFCIVINNALSIVINIQNTTIFEPVIFLRAFTLVIKKKQEIILIFCVRLEAFVLISFLFLQGNIIAV